MTSSMLTGERRWASSTRRSGMTVLGKVAVPKPINLPSQRLENNGLDPNVEIVPKGTTSWGNKSSQPNAWGGSSTLSPKTDGSTGSPSCLSGRPSSGGSNTRPSTAGSDRSQETAANAWGPSSRPLSASGVLSSNQSSLALLRPRSAETRPGSSQKTRFAEPLSENSVAWGAAGTTAEDVSSSKKDGFSLSSGDFPTLGSEKEITGKNVESQDHNALSRPGSSPRTAPVNERTETSEDIKNGDEVCHGEDGARPVPERWQGDGRPFPGASMPPQHYDTWHGPHPNNLPGGVWYRGPPYGAPVPPGGYPMEPFPYYRPQVPAASFPNPQPGPPQGVVPRGVHSKNGEMYRPPVPDPCIRPGMPMQPGFYPAPMPYEGYYGPPMGYCGPNDRDIPFIGMAAAPVYSRYPGHSGPDPANLHARPSVRGPAGKSLVPEQVESDRPHDNRGPYKVLLKQHNGWDEKKGEKFEIPVASNVASAGKSDRQRRLWDDELAVDHRKHAKLDSQKAGDSESPRSSSVPETLGNLKPSDPISTENSVPAGSSAGVRRLVPPGQRDSSLFQKIEGLNAKARASGAGQDITNEHVADPAFVDSTQPSGICKPVTNEAGLSAQKGFETEMTSGKIVSRSAPVPAKNHNRGKGRFGNPNDDNLGKKPSVTNSSIISSDAPSGSAASVYGQDSNTSVEKPGLYSHRRHMGEPTTQKLDSNDGSEQRAKMRGLGKQRSEQLQKEEEERVRKQKAKAHEKLRELNRRTQRVETSHQEEIISADAVQKNCKQQEPCIPLEPKMITAKSGAPASASASIQYHVAPVAENTKTGKPDATEPPKGRPDDTYLERVTGQNQSKSLQQNSVSVDSGVGSYFRVQDSKTVRHRGSGHKLNHNGLSERNTGDNNFPSSTIETSQKHSDGSVNAGASTKDALSSATNQNTLSEPSTHQNKRSNRTGRNRHRVEMGSTTVSVSAVSKQIENTNPLAETGGPKSSVAELSLSSAQSGNKSKDVNHHPSEQQSLALDEETHGRMKNEWRSQQPNWMPRNPQGNRSTERFNDGDAVVWAPVRVKNKSETSNDSSQKTVFEDAVSLGKNNHQVQNNPKNKRAEMERYVPKPIAKEMAQQGSKQQSVFSSASQSPSDETTGRVNSDPHNRGNSKAPGTGTGKVESGMDFRQGKAHRSQHQQHSEIAHMQDLQDGSSLISNQCGDISKSVDCHISKRDDVPPLKEQPKHPNEWDASDGWNMPEDLGSVAPTPIIRDQATLSRGKRYSHKQHRGSGNNHSFDKKFSRGDNHRIEEPTFHPEMIQTEIPATKETRGYSERSVSHWQPKSQGANIQQGDRSSASAEVQPNKKASQPQGRMSQQQHKGTARAEPGDEQIILPKSSLEEVPDQDKSDRNRYSSRGRPNSSDHALASVDEANTQTTDSGHEQHPSSGYRKNGNQNSHFSRGQRSRGEWASSGQGLKQQHPSGNRFRQRHNSHYEYQPVDNRSNDYDGSNDNSRNTGVKYREKGQSHSKQRGGNFRGHSIQVDGGND